MERKTFTVDIDVITQMHSLEAYRKYSTEELIRLIRIGIEFLEEDEGLLKEQHLKRPYYHLSLRQSEAYRAAIQYRSLKEAKP